MSLKCKTQKIYYYYYYYYYYIRLTAFSPGNLGNAAPEKENILDFTGARDDGVEMASAGVLDHMQIICT